MQVQYCRDSGVPTGPANYCKCVLNLLTECVRVFFCVKSTKILNNAVLQTVL